MKTKLTQSAAALLFSIFSVAEAGEQAKIVPAATIDWENVRLAPARLSVLNMKPAPLKASEGGGGWLSVPPRFQSHATTIFMPAGETNGVADFKVEADGFLLVACNYDYQGNSSGNWSDEAWSPKKFGEHGWKEISAAELGGMLVSSRNRAQKIFIKHVRAGESGRIRCNKHDPPFFILCGSEQVRKPGRS